MAQPSYHREEQEEVNPCRTKGLFWQIVTDELLPFISLPMNKNLHDLYVFTARPQCIIHTFATGKQLYWIINMTIHFYSISCCDDETQESAPYLPCYPRILFCYPSTTTCCILHMVRRSLSQKKKVCLLEQLGLFVLSTTHFSLLFHTKT